MGRNNVAQVNRFISGSNGECSAGRFPYLTKPKSRATLRLIRSPEGELKPESVTAQGAEKREKEPGQCVELHRGVMRDGGKVERLSLRSMLRARECVFVWTRDRTCLRENRLERDKLTNWSSEDLAAGAAQRLDVVAEK
ncbi:hypothetical protein AOLI_G00037420 [Acnodon oligacanthus]